MSARPYGSETYCGWETDVDEVCGDTPHADMTAVVRISKPLTDVAVEKPVHEFLCYKHAQILAREAVSIVSSTAVKPVKPVTERG